MKFYLSHPIRGSKGKDATVDDMRKNNGAAIVVANYLRDNLIASVDIHVPAEMEEFVLIAYNMAYLTEKQILAVDCKIIDSCDAVIIYAPEGSVNGGCKIELDHAIKYNIPVFIGKDVETLLNMITEFIVRA